jgi:hypothetical protein
MRLAGSEIDQVTGPFSAVSVVDPPSSGMGVTLVGATVRVPCAGWLDALALGPRVGTGCEGDELPPTGGELLATGGELLATGGELLAAGGELLAAGGVEVARAESDGAERTAPDTCSLLPELPELAVGAAPARPLAPGLVADGASLGPGGPGRPVTGLRLANPKECVPPVGSSTATVTAIVAVPAATATASWACGVRSGPMWLERGCLGKPFFPNDRWRLSRAARYAAASGSVPMAMRSA